MNGYMLDTNVFNRVLDGQIQLPVLESGVRFYATHVQIDELAATHDEERRKKLLDQFLSISPDALPTASLVLGVSRLNRAKLSDGVLYAQIKRELDKRNGRKRNNAQDTLIAETAIKSGLILVTEDKNLLAVVTRIGGSAIHIRDIAPSGPNKGQTS